MANSVASTRQDPAKEGTPQWQDNPHGTREEQAQQAVIANELQAHTLQRPQTTGAKHFGGVIFGIDEAGRWIYET